jgi:hypothetical protein
VWCGQLVDRLNVGLALRSGQDDIVQTALLHDPDSVRRNGDTRHDTRHVNRATRIELDLALDGGQLPQLRDCTAALSVGPPWPSYDVEMDLFQAGSSLPRVRVSPRAASPF